uniref:Uncharacterized protein n=1 Tax=Anguilla anguilla TaxID=7936 RepID=A0A0E9WTI3_ANGAN
MHRAMPCSTGSDKGSCELKCPVCMKVKSISNTTTQHCARYVSSIMTIFKNKHLYTFPIDLAYFKTLF